MNDKNLYTKKFIKEAKSLITTGVAGSYADIADNLEWSRTSMSNVINGRRSVPIAIYRLFTEVYKIKGEILPGSAEGSEWAYNPHTDKLINSLEDQIKTLKENNEYLKQQLSLATQQVRNYVLQSHAIVQTNQDALADLLVKQKIESADSVSGRLSTMNVANQVKLKKEAGIVEPSGK